MRSVFVVIAGIMLASFAHAGVLGDVNGDGQVGLSEAIHALQVVSGTKVTITSASEITVVSQSVLFTDHGQPEQLEQTIMVVPQGKSFILTDIFINSVSYSSFTTYIFKIKENQNAKMELLFEYPSTFERKFNSGIPFASESQINVAFERLTGSQYGSFSVLICGYEVKN